MKSEMLFIVLIGCFTAPFAIADESSPVPSINLDVTTAVSMAQSHNYPLKQAMVDLETTRNAAETSWTSFYPTASLSGSLSTNNSGSTGLTSNSLSAGLSLGLGLGAPVGFEIKQLWNEYESGLVTYEQVKAKLAVQVKKYYYSLLLYQEQFDLLSKQTQAASQRADTAAFKYSIGLFSEIDKLSVEYAFKDRQFALKTLENNFQTSLMQFKQLLGIDQKTAVNLSDGIPEAVRLQFDPALAAMDNNTDLRLLELSLAAAQIARDKNVAALFPSLSLGFSLSYAFGGDPFVQSVFDGTLWNPSLAFRVGVSLPIDSYLPFSSTQLNIMRQNAAMQKLVYSIQDKTETIRQQAATLGLLLSQIESQISSLSVNIDMAGRNLELIEQLYNNGKKSFLDLKDAENSLYDARVKLIGAKYNYLSGILDLEYLLNTDLGM